MGEHRANAARFLEVRTTRRSTMPPPVEEAWARFHAKNQGSHRNRCNYESDDEYDEDYFRASWNGQGSGGGVPQQHYAPRPHSSTQPSGRASSLSSPFDQAGKDDHEAEPTYTQAQVDSMQKIRDHQWEERMKRELQQFEVNEMARQKKAVGNAIQAVQQEAREELDKQYADYAKELDAYKEIAANEKGKMERALKDRNADLERQLAMLTQEVSRLQLSLAEPSKPQNQGGASAHPPQDADDLPSVPSRHLSSPSRTPPVSPQATQAPPATPTALPNPPPPTGQSTPAPPEMYTVANVPPMMPAGYPTLQTAKSGTSSSPYLEAFVLSAGGCQPKYGPFLLHLADLNSWDLNPKSKAGGAALALASGATDIVCGALALAGSEGSYVDRAYANNLGDFGESPNHSLEGNAAKAKMPPQNYMLEHWKRFQAREYIFLVKAKAGETIYVATSLSLALVSGRHEVNCLYQIGGSDTIEPRTISTDEIQFYAALQVDKDVMERWFQCAQFPEEFTTSWNSSVDVIQETVYTPSNQPALGFLKK